MNESHLELFKESSKEVLEEFRDEGTVEGAMVHAAMVEAIDDPESWWNKQKVPADQRQGP